MEESSTYVTNMNRALKNIKSEVMVDFVQVKTNSIIIVTNKVTLSLDLQTIENYIKNINHINTDGIKVPRLSLLKSYFKIISIPYLQENTNNSLTLNVVENIIKSNHIFNNIALASRPYIIKIFPKSDMAIIWVDIWDVQSRSKTKRLINRCFNVGSYITIVRGTNMNPGISQCKNCWKWEHSTFSCKIQEAKCIKCNVPHKSKHY